MIRFSLLFSPRPATMLIRKVFTQSGGVTAAKLEVGAPTDVVSIIDERYEHQPDALIDVHIPIEAADGDVRLPTVVWVHGGAFVGGSKEELSGYLKRIARSGFTVVAPRYSLAPGATHPTPIRQVGAVLTHLQESAHRLHADPSRVLLAGDSAGAMIAAQTAMVITNPTYARALGVVSPLAPEALRGVVLCCGPFDLVGMHGSSRVSGLVEAVLWAYSGRREYLRDEYFLGTMAVMDFVGPAFPPAFVTAGNADPLFPQSVALVSALEQAGVSVESLFFPPDHRPALGHEYQFDLDLEEARLALDRLVEFIERRAAGEE